MHDTASVIGQHFLRQYSRAEHLIVEIDDEIRGLLADRQRPLAAGHEIDPRTWNEVNANVPRFGMRKGANAAVDATSVMEHDKLFWVTFLDMLRITKAGGLIYINAPSNGVYHRYPVDNWRFYPDAGKALETWARQSGFAASLVESFVAERIHDVWNDFVAIFQLEPLNRPYDFLSEKVSCFNVWHCDGTEPSRTREESEDTLLLQNAINEIRELRARNAALTHELLRAKTYAAAFADVVDPHYRPAFRHSMQIDGLAPIDSPGFVPDQEIKPS